MRKRRIICFFAVLALTAACSERPAVSAISASGTVEAPEVNVAARVPGQITELAVEEGRRVAAGDVLARLDTSSYEIQLRQAEAGVALARAQLEILVRGARDEDIRQAEEQLKQVETSLKVAEDDFRRMSTLERAGGVSSKQREDAEARYNVLSAQKKAASEALAKLRRLARPEEIRAAEARLRQAEAAADLLRKTIADCTIVSPVSGLVTRKPVEAGEYVMTGSTVVSVAALDPVYVMLYINEKEVGRVRLGDPVEVSVDSFSGRLFTGRVAYISPEAEFTPKNVQTKEDRVKLVFGVKVVIPNPEGLLKPGLPADAVIKTGAAEEKPGASRS
jgi:HlyD family secretion protein